MIFDYRKAHDVTPDGYNYLSPKIEGITEKCGCGLGRAAVALDGFEDAWSKFRNGMTEFGYIRYFCGLFEISMKEAEKAERMAFRDVLAAEKYLQKLLVSKGHTVILEDETILEPKTVKNVQETTVKEPILV